MNGFGRRCCLELNFMPPGQLQPEPEFSNCPCLFPFSPTQSLSNDWKSPLEVKDYLIRFLEVPGHQVKVTVTSTAHGPGFVNTISLQDLEGTSKKFGKTFTDKPIKLWWSRVKWQSDCVGVH